MAWSSVQKYIAEFIGTFGLLLSVSGAALFTSVLEVDFAARVLLISLALGAGVIGMIYAVGDISGGHFNPAVTLAMWASGRLPARDVVPYIVAQVLGGLVAVGIVVGVLSGLSGVSLSTIAGANGFASQGYSGNGAPYAYSVGSVFLLEVTMTFFLVFVILFATRSDSSAKNLRRSRDRPHPDHDQLGRDPGGSGVGQPRPQLRPRLALGVLLLWTMGDQRRTGSSGWLRSSAGSSRRCWRECSGPVRTRPFYALGSDAEGRSPLGGEQARSLGRGVEYLARGQGGSSPGESLFLELGRLGPHLEHRLDQAGGRRRPVPRDAEAVVRFVQHDPTHRDHEVKVHEPGTELTLALRLGPGEHSVSGSPPSRAGRMEKERWRNSSTVDLEVRHREHRPRNEGSQITSRGTRALENRRSGRG